MEVASIVALKNHSIFFFCFPAEILATLKLLKVTFEFREYFSEEENGEKKKNNQ
jgi:hypothetical protein